MTIGENGEVHYDYELNRLLKKYKLRGFFFKHFRMFKKRFETENDIKFKFDYCGVLRKHEILYSSPNYSIEKLYRTKFFIKRKIEETTIEMTSKNNLDNLQLGFLAVIFTVAGILCDGISVGIKDNVNVIFFLRVVYVLWVICFFRKVFTKQDKKINTKKFSLRSYFIYTN